MVSWDAPDTLPGFGGSPTPPSDGTSWVVVTLSVARPAESGLCLPRLFGEGTQSWATVSLPPTTDNPGYCDAGVGEMLIDGVYEVPSHKLPDVRGVGYEPFKQRQPALLLFPER